MLIKYNTRTKRKDTEKKRDQGFTKKNTHTHTHKRIECLSVLSPNQLLVELLFP